MNAFLVVLLLSLPARAASPYAEHVSAFRAYEAAEAEVFAKLQLTPRPRRRQRLHPPPRLCETPRPHTRGISAAANHPDVVQSTDSVVRRSLNFGEAPLNLFSRFLCVSA
jgi:hypothetical protein